MTVFAKTLNHYFKGHPLKRIDITVAKKLNVSEKELKKGLEGSKLKPVQRERKTLAFHFDNGQILGLHLMLRGELTLQSVPDYPKFMYHEQKINVNATIYDKSKVAFVAICVSRSN